MMRELLVRKRPIGYRRGQRGFTLLELVVVTGILGLLLIGILALFDSSTRVAAGQTARTEMQQSLRVVLRDVTRKIRMLGRGGLPPASNTRALPALGLSVALRNNVAANNRIEPTDAGSPLIEPGTDVLVLRGVFEPDNLWVAKSQDNPTTNVFAWDLATTATILLRERTPNDSGDQTLQALVDLAANPRPEAILLVSGFSDALYGVAEFVSAVVGVDAAGVTQVTATLRVISGSPYADAYNLLSTDGNFPAARLVQSGIGFVGILDEYRYYIRQANAVEGDLSTPIIPRLSRARTYPSTTVAWSADPTNLRVDIADYIVDFQAALGFDLDADGWVEETATRSDAGDEWMGNHIADDPVGVIWSPVMGSNSRSFQAVRLTAVGRSGAPDRSRRSQPIARIEDRDYTAAMNDLDDVLYQREVLQTVVDMRNM